MNHSIKVGFSFGLTSAIITTLGVLVGLSASTQSKVVVLGGIFTIAIADAFSDALGIHISEESEGRHSDWEIWQSTISTFFFKFIFAMTFIIPVLLLDLQKAVMASIIWGALLLFILSWKLSDKKRWKIIFEHFFIAAVVIFLTYYAGNLIAVKF